VTGGATADVEPLLRIERDHVPDLVLRGLAEVVQSRSD
jgi:hypothetical protein